ncbi:MAG: GNAT family N-acetyltransferase [Anaerolineae bacterium]|nr:GNAT family N-acetyltransferase [Anaerolineae bacterium]
MTTPPLTRITHRPLQGKTDAMRLRQFLIDTYTCMGREFNWETRRWEGSYWCVTDAELADPNWGANTHLWENAEGAVIGAAIPDGSGDLALQIHPDYRPLEDEILDWAEIHLTALNEAGQRRLIVWAFDWDTARQQRLAHRGYVPHGEWCFHHRRRAVSDPVPQVSVAEGYTIRSVQPIEADVERWIACTNITFGQSFPPEMHRNFQLYSPSHNYDLHIVAEAPDGTFAAFAGLTVELINRFATFEPVGTHPDHRRKGLARAVMYEAMRRLQALGTADTVYVANWGTADAGQLYAAVGMQHYATFTIWEKIFI